VADLARVAGVSRPALQVQLVRGRAAETVVISAARAMHIDPVSALSHFDPYSGLDDRMASPSLAEVLSQTTFIGVAVQVTARFASSVTTT
jgi:hypothetical protein